MSLETPPNPVPPTAKTPLTRIDWRGGFLIFKSALSEQECIEKFGPSCKCVTYPDVDALWADDRYSGRKADFQAKVDQPEILYFYCEFDPNDEYRWRPSDFPFWEVNGLILNWADWNYVHFKRKRREFLKVYRSPNDTAPHVIRLSTALVALLREQPFLNPKALANDIRQEDSVFLFVARLDGRLL